MHSCPNVIATSNSKNWVASEKIDGIYKSLLIVNLQITRQDLGMKDKQLGF